MSVRFKGYSGTLFVHSQMDKTGCINEVAVLPGLGKTS